MMEKLRMRERGGASKFVMGGLVREQAAKGQAPPAPNCGETVGNRPIVVAVGF
jgi:hypothetical protein